MKKLLLGDEAIAQGAIDAGLSGEPLEGTFEEIRKLVSVLK